MTVENHEVSLVPLQTRRATKEDLPTLARIHKIAYSRSHFTALLPEHVLASYYGLFLDGGSEILLVFKLLCDGSEDQEDKEVIEGLAVYGVNIPQRIAAFKRDHFQDILVASLRHPVAAARKILAGLVSRLERHVPHKSADFLLLSIAVTVPRQGIGRRLLESMLDYARIQGFNSVGLYVNKDNVGAINAYFAAGFQVMSSQGGQFYMERYFSYE